MDEGTNTVSIRLTDNEIMLARELAKQQWNKYKDQRGYYNNGNSLSQHILSAYGEMGVRRFYGLDRDADGYSDGTLWGLNQFIRFEIKSWQVSCYDELGRALQPKQLPHKLTYAAIIWCAVYARYQQGKLSVDIIIHGWNTPAEIKKANIVNKLNLYNYQLNENELHDPNVLLWVI